MGFWVGIWFFSPYPNPNPKNPIKTKPNPNEKPFWVRKLKKNEFKRMNFDFLFIFQ